MKANLEARIIGGCRFGHKIAKILQLPACRLGPQILGSVERVFTTSAGELSMQRVVLGQK